MNATDFNELLNKKEELHEDLKPYICDNGNFVSLKHPLVFDVIYSPDKNALNNYQYEQKRKCIKEHIENDEFSQIIWMYERPHRIEAFLEYVVPNLPNDSREYWDILKSVAMDSENIWQWKDDYKRLIVDVDSVLTRMMMNKEELEIFKQLPDKVTVYRGINEILRCDSERRNGYSWTLSEETAEFFANRLKREYEDAVILVGEVDKSSIKAYFDGRNEKEIIVDYNSVALT